MFSCVRGAAAVARVANPTTTNIPRTNIFSILPSRYSTSTEPSSKRIDPIDRFAHLVKNNLSTNAQLPEVLNAVWTNEVVTSQCPDLIIRLTSLRGQVSSRLWKMLGGDPEEIQILAVGTTAIPNHMKDYKSFIDGIGEAAARHAAEHRRDADYEIGYDLFSKGSEESRGATLRMFNEHYGFSQERLDSCIQSSAISCGGMRALKDLADGCVIQARQSGEMHRFIAPDNSFGTYWNISEHKFKGGSSLGRESIMLPTSPEYKLHLSPADVEKFYEENRPAWGESWYITPVGNPSGTTMDGDVLTETVKTILKHNPKAIIILDAVYTRTLTRERSCDLWKGVVNDDNILERVIFLESFSKSHGLCRERLGLYFSTNAKLFTDLHAANIGFSAGPGAFKDYQFYGLGNLPQEHKDAVDGLHIFWRDERKSLLKFLQSGPHAEELFDSKQEHLDQRDIEDPCTLYILLKTKECISAKDIFLRTGALGVDTPLASGHYVRFSVGALRKPTYSVRV